MKPFDLEAAKRGEPIRTKDGRLAKFIAHVPEARLYQKVLVLVEDIVLSTNNSGKAVLDEDNDLVMVPQTHTVWVNLYEGGQYNARDNEAAADHVATLTLGERIGGKAYPIEIEE